MVDFVCDLATLFGYKPGMPLSEYRERHRGAELLLRSLGRGRLAHAYLFAGEDIELLETIARELAKVIDCAQPLRATDHEDYVDSCGSCSPCHRIDGDAHPDVLWIRPESKSRVITIDQVRDVLHVIGLKPTEARTKVAVIVGADRMNVQAANAFLKTLEEPPGNAVLILLTTRPRNLLETIVSRCLFLRFGGDEKMLPECVMNWLSRFADAMLKARAGVMPRYGLLSGWLEELAGLRARVAESVRARSPMEQHEDVEPKLREKWENEIKAAAESEYRRLRADYLTGLQFYFRDVWVRSLGVEQELLTLPGLAKQAERLCGKLHSRDAHENVHLLSRAQGLLETNLQEALVLEVLMLRLKF